jgi:predicted DNA-binding transcriptional regulator YafY
MADHTPLQRQWLLLRMLARRGGAAVREVAEEHGVSQKTIRRDLATLQSVGFGLVEETAPHGKKFWRLQFDDDLPAPSFNYDELAALYLGRRFLEPLAGTIFADAAHSALAKIRAGLLDTALRYLEKVAASVHRTTFGTGDYAARAEVVESLRHAVEDRRITIITYRSLRSTEPVTYEVYPYGLVLHRDSLYLVAFSVDHDEVRHFKIDRVEEAEAQGLPFERPADFDLAEHLHRAFGIYEQPGPPITVRIRFSPAVARYVEESHWHPTQRLDRTPDGHLLVEFEVTALAEVQSWVLSFGAKVEVLEPEELRDGVVGELQRALASYNVGRTAKH